MGSAKYQTDGDLRTSGPGFGLALHHDSLYLPYTWNKPQKVFVNSMSDLFHARVPLAFVREVFGVIADTPQHTYQVLTKRSLRLPRVAEKLDWPPNLWMGVSVEDATELARIDHLRAVPAAVRFLSCEPLIGDLGDLDLGGIGWLICGGESGSRARPMHPRWARTLRDQCVSSGVPYFFKQWGEFAPSRHDEAWQVGTEFWPVWRYGRKKAARELDGRTWDQFPLAADLAGAA
jgi:protein gp37